jgi:hypothetical protein
LEIVMHREKEVRYNPETGEKIVTEQVVSDRTARPSERVERIIEKPTIIKKRAGVGTWLGGVVVGGLLVAGGFALMAQDKGSYQAAGAAVDQKVSETGQATQNAAESVGDAAKDAGQKIENATDPAPDGK